MNENKMVLVLSSLIAGGMERVMSELANFFAVQGYQVKLILLSKKERFYNLHHSIEIVEPAFTIDQMPRPLFMMRDFLYVRKQLKLSQGKNVLMFSGKYNGFVLLASLGLRKNVYISDRSRPSISYGKFLDNLNPFVYKLAKGIIAQTSTAKKFEEKRSKHKNVKVIGNPIRQIGGDVCKRSNTILNVGRFIPSKHQDWLIDYFNNINNSNWRLIIIGEGALKEALIKKIEDTGNPSNIEVLPSTNKIDQYYQNAAIFAFTSTSEGFPNALGEAMSAGCACISFDCEAGPSELIDDGKNGFLIPERDHEQYKVKLNRLMEDLELRQRFGKAAKQKIQQFEIKRIANEYLEFMQN